VGVLTAAFPQRDELAAHFPDVPNILILPAYIAWRRPNFVTRYRTAAASEARMAGARTS